MAISYDSYYETPNLFGDPYPELLEFFSGFPEGGKVLDLGCGQGRDAIALARMGFEVTGVDYSKVGIAQMLELAEQEQLSLKGLVDDIYRFDAFAPYDFVLFDSMFHFQKKDKEKETALVSAAVEHTKLGCVIIFCIQDLDQKVEILQNTIEHAGGCELLKDISFEYHYHDEESGHHSTTAYRLIAVRKMAL